MSSTHTPYFYAAALERRFSDDLVRAVQSGHLEPHECLWLNTLTRKSTGTDPDPVRADRIVLGEGATTPVALAAALMLSHGLSNDPAVYLYTFEAGIEAFPDRPALMSALRQRYTPDEKDALFEHEEIDGDAFHAQMLALVDRQAGLIGQLAEQFDRLPSLTDVSAASITLHLRDSLPHLPVDPRTHLLQLVSESGGNAPRVVATCTLAQAALDDCCQVPLADNVRRRFLDARGWWANAADTALFNQALTRSVATVAEQYAQQLAVFWQGSWRGAHTVRDLAIESYRNGMRQAFYRKRHDDSVDEPAPAHVQSSLDPGIPTARCTRLRLKVGDSEWVTLAATFVVQSAVQGDTSLLWFSPDHYWIRFDDLIALTGYVASEQGRAQIRSAVRLSEQLVLQQQGLWRVELEPISGGLAEDRVDSILALQARNLDDVMRLPGRPGQFPAMIDDALDIRLLLDPRQLRCGAGRWRRAAPFDFHEVWLSPRPAVRSLTTGEAGAEQRAGERTADEHIAVVDPLPAEPPQPDSLIKNSWLERTRSFDRRAEPLQTLDSVLLDHAEQVLQPYVSVLTGGTVNAASFLVQCQEAATSILSSAGTPSASSASQSSVDLVSLLLECVSGRRSTDLGRDVRILIDLTTPSVEVPTALIGHMLNQVKASFVEGYLRHFERSRSRSVRQGDISLEPFSEALSLREEAMRMSLALCERRKKMNPACIDMARQVLDTPARSLRTTLVGTVTEAFSISLRFGNHRGALLCDTLLLQQPGNPHGRFVFWSSVTGWFSFSSVEHMKRAFQKDLHGAERTLWLQHLGDQDSRLLQAHLLTAVNTSVDIELNRLDGHAVSTLQQQALYRQRQSLQALCQRAVRSRFGASVFKGLALAGERDDLLDFLLDDVSISVKTSMFEAMLPAWVSSASVADLQQFNEITQRYYRACERGKDFMFAIPSLQDYAHQQVSARLLRDFPELGIDPDRVSITLRRYVSSFPSIGQVTSSVPAATVVRSESLTRYAINRFVNFQDAALSVDVAPSDAALAVITPAYVRTLVRELDVGNGYINLLRRELNPANLHYPLRKRLFVEQLPPALMAMALPEKLQGKLSARAYAFISGVVEMPDGIAREPVNGTRVVISPLQLIADRDMAPDTVTGMYLIGPATEAGPVVLYVAYYDPFTFREYASREALMEDIRRDESLQHLILERLDPEIRRRYDHGGFIEPHLPFSVEAFYDVPVRSPGPVTLGVTEVRGNALQFLFRDAVKLMLDTGVSNVVTNAQSDQAGRAFLATLGFEQALGFLPGKLGALVGLWQSRYLLRASAVSANGHRWGEAISEFSAAMGMMIAAREQTPEVQPSEEEPGAPSIPGTEESARDPFEFSWRDSALTPEQRVQLQALEAKGVALSEMHHDDLLNLYRDKVNDTPYAVVAGKVYQVRSVRENGIWSIVGADGRPGPRVILDEDLRWQLDLGLRLIGGGAAVGTLRTIRADRTAEDVIIVEARGMPEIRQLYRDRARRIAQAHLRARRYLENCLDNLKTPQPESAMDPVVVRLLADFFGVQTADAVLLGQIESIVKTLLDAIMDASLSPFTSPRFVVGSTRPGMDPVTAFVIKDDPQHRLFLTEHFFNVPQFTLKPEAGAQGFDLSGHYRAANLIHELSHLELDTHDIAYLNAMAPYTDLMSVHDPATQKMQAHAEHLQTRRLSHLSSKSLLFKVTDGGELRDIEAGDDRGYDVILRATGTTSIDEARDVFLADARKRSEVMLSNADTVTLLVLSLGRNNRQVAYP